MGTYSIDDLRRKSSVVFNDVMVNKEVTITHRDRPEMKLVMSDHLAHLKERAAKNEG
jgi:hypothetical protein